MHFYYYIGLWLLEYVSIRTSCSKEAAVVNLCKDSKATSPPVCRLGPVDRVPAPAQPSVGSKEGECNCRLLITGPDNTGPSLFLWLIVLPL